MSNDKGSGHIRKYHFNMLIFIFYIPFDSTYLSEELLTIFFDKVILLYLSKLCIFILFLKEQKVWLTLSMIAYLLFEEGLNNIFYLD